MQTCSGGISVRDVDQSLLIETDSKILLNRFIYSLDCLSVELDGCLFFCCGPLIRRLSRFFLLRVGGGRLFSYGMLSNRLNALCLSC